MRAAVSAAPPGAQLVTDALLSHWPEAFRGQVSAETLRVRLEPVSPKLRVIRFADSRSRIHGVIRPDYAVEVTDGRTCAKRRLAPPFGSELRVKELDRIHDRVDIPPAREFAYTVDLDTESYSDVAYLVGGLDASQPPPITLTLFAPFTELSIARMRVGGDGDGDGDGGPVRHLKLSDRNTERLQRALAREAERLATREWGYDLFQSLDAASTAAGRSFSSLCNKVAHYVRTHGLLRDRGEGRFYGALPGCPCAYEPAGDYGWLLNAACEDDETYEGDVNNFDKLLAFVRRSDTLPDLWRDHDLLSFSNGVLRLSTNEFVPYTDPLLPDAAGRHPLQGRVARHHVPAAYTGSEDTPRLDALLASSRVDAATAEFLCALLGRALFPVGHLDDWQVLVCLLGSEPAAGLREVLTSLFAPRDVGTVGLTEYGPHAPGRARRPQLLTSLHDMHNRRLVVGMARPARLSRALPPAALQRVTSGETGPLPLMRAAVAAPLVMWKAPLVLAVEAPPDYAGAEARRVVTFCFNAPQVADNGLVQRIIRKELPNVACRFVGAYHRLLKRAPYAAGNAGLWDCAPRSRVLLRPRPAQAP
jgi:hypothetical protein